MKLPKTVKVSLLDLMDSWFDDELTQRINDYLSNKYGYCVNGYVFDDIITITNIDWDTEE